MSSYDLNYIGYGLTDMDKIALAFAGARAAFLVRKLKLLLLYSHCCTLK